MRFGCARVLIAFLVPATVAAESLRVTEVPPLLRAKLLAKEELAGTFEQTKTSPEGEAFVSRGAYRLRPGVDFTWRTTDPFDALFQADRKSYTYSNEDECVTHPLRELKGYSAFAEIGEGDFSKFFEAFDSLYREEPGGVFHVLARPKERHLAKVLARVEADGVVSNWCLRATFADKTVFAVTFRDAPPKSARPELE